MERERFMNSTVSQIKCAAGLNVHRERAKNVDKSNECVCCQLCKVEESWKHVLLCGTLKERREAWTSKMQKKLDNVAKN